MSLSLGLIVENLLDYDAQIVGVLNRDFSFSGIQVLTQPAETLSTDTLYVCTTGVLPRLSKNLFDKHCFVFKARPQQVQCNHALNGIILGEDSDLCQVINHLISLFSSFQMFEHSIKEAVLSQQGYEPLFEIARKTFPNCLLVITDSAYNIVCSTKQTVDNNEYLDALLQRGYYNREDLNLMAAYGYYDDERKYFRPILYGREQTICRLPFLVKSYRSNGAAFSFIGCYFLHDEPTERDIALFSCIAQELDVYYEINGVYKVGMLSRQKQLLDDLIYPKQNTPEYLRDRCVQLGLPFQCSFRIGLVQSESASTIKVSQIVNQLRAHCPLANYGVFQYDDTVIIPFQDWKAANIKTQSSFSDNWNLLTSTLRQNKAYMGLSLLFTGMAKFSVAYQQALSAVNIGRKREQGTQAFFYSKYYLADMLCNYNSVMPLEDVYTRSLDQLIDSNSGPCSNIKLLYYYLCSERNISLTAKCVHMHRNSVIYRIQKIRDILLLDLDDPNVRLRLMVSFNILELSGRLPKWESPLDKHSCSTQEDNVFLQE